MRHFIGKMGESRNGSCVAKSLIETCRLLLSVRVIVVDGYRRETKDPSSSSSRVSRRELDTSEWHVRNYDQATGDFVLARGSGTPRLVDQFEIADLGQPARAERNGFAFIRSPEVRRSALARANGKCEYCGAPGFPMENGCIYLETHRIVPLSEDGPDSIQNVAALCPNDHRRAHFSAERQPIAAFLLSKLTKN